MTKLPPWNDEAACLVFIEDWDSRRLFDMSRSRSTPLRFETIALTIEKNAVIKAKKGQRRELAKLIRPSSYYNRGATPFRSRLSGETWSLVADLLEGKKHAKQARPKMTEEERRAKNPIHNAADLAQDIEQVFRDRYPEVSEKDRKARAIKFAAMISEVNPNTLKKHVGRKPGDHRKISTAE